MKIDTEKNGSSKWDSRYMRVAEIVATWSKDPSTKVGAVIVDSRNRPVSFGYNGFARGVRDTQERLNNREIKYTITSHGETNAILNAASDLGGCTIYVTSPVCAKCMSEIIQTGIARVVYKEGGEDFMSRWSENHKIALEIAEEVGIQVEII